MGASMGRMRRTPAARGAHLARVRRLVSVARSRTARRSAGHGSGRLAPLLGTRGEGGCGFFS